MVVNSHVARTKDSLRVQRSFSNIPRDLSRIHKYRYSRALQRDHGDARQVNYGIAIDSPLRNGVCTGNRRTFVACSKL